MGSCDNVANVATTFQDYLNIAFLIDIQVRSHSQLTHHLRHIPRSTGIFQQSYNISV